MHEHPQQAPTAASPVVTRVVAAAFIGVLLFFLITEHTAHFFGVLPYLLFLLCPLMHFFMHRGHGGHAGCGGGSAGGTESKPDSDGRQIP